MTKSSLIQCSPLLFLVLAAKDVDMNEMDETNQDAGETLPVAEGNGVGPNTNLTTQRDVQETEGGLALNGSAKKDDDGKKNLDPNDSEEDDGAEKRYPRRTQQKTSLEDTGLPPLLANMGWGGKQIKVTIRIEGGSLETSSPSLLGGSPSRLSGRGGRGRGGRGGREYPEFIYFKCFFAWQCIVSSFGLFRFFFLGYPLTICRWAR